MLTVSPYALPLPRGRDELHTHSLDRVVEYYSEAGPDFATWSNNFNMHFGYFQRGMNPLRREPMLARMNAVVLDALQLDERSSKLIADMGCGLGSTARYAARNIKDCFINCVTCVPWQIARGRELTERQHLHRRVVFFLADLAETPFADGMLDGVYAVESSRYARGTDKREFLAESYRLLKPGARLVVADGFLKGTHALNAITEYCHRKVCAGWALDNFATLERFEQRLASQGFEEIEVREIGWHLLPSVLHVPAIAAKLLWREFNHHYDPPNAPRRAHLFASLFGIALGLARHRFGYYLISAKKPRN